MAHIAERFEDMSQRGRLRVLQQSDGDMIIEVIEDPHSQGSCAGLSASVEFCTSGGKSPKTLAALRALMLAMAEENAESVHCHRRGEIGLGVDAPVPDVRGISPLEEVAYGTTEFGFTFAGIELAEGDKRLLSLITQALGNDHQAFNDLSALVSAARTRPLQQPLLPVQTHLDQIDAETAADEWLRGMLPTDRSIAFWQHERFSFSPHNGRVVLIRCKERPVAAALIVRDGLNRSQLLRWQAPSVPDMPDMPEVPEVPGG